MQILQSETGDSKFAILTRIADELSARVHLIPVRSSFSVIPEEKTTEEMK